MPNNIKNKLNPIFLSKLENLYGSKSNNSKNVTTPGTGILNNIKKNIIIKKIPKPIELEKKIPIIKENTSTPLTKTKITQAPLTNNYNLSTKLIETILIHYNYHTKLFLDCYSKNKTKKIKKKRKKKLKKNYLIIKTKKKLY